MNNPNAMKTKLKPVKNIKTTVVNVNSSNSSLDKTSSDTNNNGKKKSPRNKKDQNKKLRFSKRLLDKSLSFRVLEDHNKSKENGLDVYEFVFDPNEEPKPQKKKRKRVVQKKPRQPKPVFFKSNYNLNISKALAGLKTKVKPSKSQKVQNSIKPIEVQNTKSSTSKVHTEKPPTDNNTNAYAPTLEPLNETSRNSIHDSNYVSIRVEDIAADFEIVDSNKNNDINYSPVNSPCNPEISVTQANESHFSTNAGDPLNLQGDDSFFDEPVASSSMNVSVKHPTASPWRVEFNNLPIKWQANTYLKSNMTPAVESSFINSEDVSKEKHVYTNIMSEDNEPSPQIYDNDPKSSNLNQTSILSFIKEVVEKNANKRKRAVTPKRDNSIFDGVTNTRNDFGYKTSKKVKSNTELPQNSNTRIKKSNENISNNSSNKSVTVIKNKKQKSKDGTYFGFDDSDNSDRENISPVKKITSKAKTMKTRRAVLQEVNVQKGPMRAIMPVSVKAKLPCSDVVNQLYEQLKSGEDAPQIPESGKEAAKTVTTNVENPAVLPEDNDESQSVHLFEDLDIVHHLKPNRKSYSKPKKVVFRQHSSTDSDTQDRQILQQHNSSDEDDLAEDLADLSFHLPNVKEKKTIKKKKSKKPQLSKKEKKEIEEWAAGFNSMCEDIDEFPLVVE